MVVWPDIALHSAGPVRNSLSSLAAAFGAFTALEFSKAALFLRKVNGSAPLTAQMPMEHLPPPQRFPDSGNREVA